MRTAVRSREKRAIARAAAAMVEAGQTILLDAGSTTPLAQRSAQMEGLIVVTNSLNAAKCLTSAGDCTPRGNRVDPGWDRRSARNARGEYRQ
ncbi:hypothetical protein [Bradyrhizobium tropiciagri]|uniref:hypothetical protein n=1 Tax=Bradyrhizobium tropiciagri TaxID=312253 RepID=UPI003D317E71